ncbi:unnamed protein product, partial [Ectocarpus sp. 4 AP-2014]
MVMASIARLCKPGAFAGAVAWVAVSEALGVPLNVIHPMDIKARKRMDLGLVIDGAGQEVQCDTPNIDDTTDHFAAVVVKDGTTLLCPIHLIAPRQRAADDASGKEDYEQRVLACKERQTVRERQAAGVQAGSDTVAAEMVAAEVVVALLAVLVCRTPSENSSSARVRSSKVQYARILIQMTEGPEKQPPSRCDPFLLPPLLLLLLT